MKPALGQRVGQVVAVGVLGSVLLLVLVAAGTVTLARQRRAVPGARWATTSAAPSTMPSSGQAALLPPVSPVPAQERTLILVASPEQATAVTQQLDLARSSAAPFVVSPLQGEVLVVGPIANEVLAASLQRLVLVEGYPLGPVIDLRTPQ